MFITKKTGYSLRALKEIHKNNRGKPTSLRTICENQMLPLKYMEQLFSKLKKKNIIESKAGSHGGYFLNENFKEITLFDLISAVEDYFVAFDCSYGDQKEKQYCDEKKCDMLDFWHEINTDIKNYFQNKKLINIINKEK